MDELDQKVIPEGAMDMGHAIDRILTPEQAWKLYGVHAGGSAPRVNPGLRSRGFAEARYQGHPLAREGEQGVQRGGMERARSRVH